MSFSQIPLSLHRGITPLTHLDQSLDYVVQSSGSDTFWTQFQAQGANMSSNTININPNSPNTIISRKIYLDNTYGITLCGLNPANAPGPQSVFKKGQSGCLRQFPIMNTLSSLTIGINDSTFSTNVNEYISAITQYLSEDMKEFELSITPSYPDQTQLPCLAKETNIDPAASYGNSGVAGPPTRGGFHIEIITNAPAEAGYYAYAYLKVRVVEPMMISPLVWAGSGGNGTYAKGLCGVQTMNVSYVIDKGGNSMWQQSTGPSYIPLTQGSILQQTPTTTSASKLPIAPSPTANLLTTPGILVEALYFSVWVLQVIPQITNEVPREIAYPYSQLTSYYSQEYSMPGWSQAGPLWQEYNTTVPYVAPPSQVITISGVNLSTVPERLYVFARIADAYQSGNCYASNTFLPISQVTVTWDGQNLLSQCNESQVYEFCQENGNCLNWDAFRNYVGGVVAIDVAHQISTSSLQAPGLLSRSVLQVTATVHNTSPNLPNVGPTGNTTVPALADFYGNAPAYSTTTYPNAMVQLFLVVVESGVVGLVDSHTIRQVGVLSSKDCVDSIDYPISYDHRAETVYGSSFLSDLFSGLKKGVSSLVDFAPKAFSAFKVAQQVAPLLGFGNSGGGNSGGLRRRSRSRGRGMSGGRSRSRSHSRGRVHGRGLTESENKGGKMIDRRDLLNRK